MGRDELKSLPGRTIEVTVVTDYFCTHCAKGSNKYEEVFKDGTCTSCGAPGSEYEIRGQIKRVDLSECVVAIYATDVAEGAEAKLDLLRAALKDTKMKVLTLDTIINRDTPRREWTQKLEQVAAGALVVLVFPSAGLDTDAFQDAVVDLALTPGVRNYGVVPIYLDQAAVIAAPIQLQTRYGVDFSNTLEGPSLEFNRFINHMHIKALQLG